MGIIDRFRQPKDKQSIGVLNASQAYADPAKTYPAGELEVDNWVLSQFVLDRLVPVVGTHPYPLPELMLMVAATTYFKPKFVYEWGTHIGKAARIFYEISKAFELSISIHSIDLPDDVEHVEHPHATRGMLVKDLPEVKLHLGDGIETALQLHAKTKSKDDRPLFFVDGDHSYDSVYRELTQIYQEVKSPLILAHDTFYQVKESGYNIGPYQAINDVTKELKLDIKRLSTNTGLPGMTLLY